MTILEKTIHHGLISILFSVINWLLIDNFIIEIAFWKYIIIEIILLFSLKLFKFTIDKLKIV